MLRPCARFLAPQAAVVACVLSLVTFGTRPASGQFLACGPYMSGRFGGEVSAVAQFDANTLLVARGTWIELLSLANPNAPASFNPPRRVALPAPARKISLTQASPYAFVLLENGDVTTVPLSAAPVLTIGSPVTRNLGDAVDILGEGATLYVARRYETETSSSSSVGIYNASSGTLSSVSTIQLLTTNYDCDKLAKIGNTLWIGFHEFHSTIYGVDGINVSNPAAPVRVSTALNNIPFGPTVPYVTAIASIGNRLLLTFRATPIQDQIRTVDVTGNPVWFPAYDQNAYSSCMGSFGERLRVNFENSGIGTWNTFNPSAMTFLGAYFDSYPNVYQMVVGASGGTTDYWAAGRAGLWTMNTANPAALSVRSVLNNFPAVSTKVRQIGNTTAVLDHASNTLRLFDYTLPESQQLRGTLSLPFYSEFLELAILNGGARTLACVGTSGAPGGNSIAIIEITNPAAPTTLSTISGFNIAQMSCSTSRLYVVSPEAILRTYELSQPLTPGLRSTLTLNVPAGEFTCMTSWSNNALAIGTEDGGVLLLDTTNATAPILASTYGPVEDYHVRAMVKGTNYLYISATVSNTPNGTYDTRLDSLSVSNLASPVRRGLSNRYSGAGWPGIFDNLAYVASSYGKFLIGTRPNSSDDGTDNDMIVYELPTGFLVNENIPFPIASMPLPEAGTNGGRQFYSGSGGNVVPSADGSQMMVSAATAGLYQVALTPNWAPGFGVQPFFNGLCYGQSASYPVIASGNPVAVTYQWYRLNSPALEVPLVNGTLARGTTIAGASESVLTIGNFHPGDLLGYIYCKASNGCGTTQSYGFVPQKCPGNFNCDYFTDVQDIFDFLNAWFAGSSSADVNGVGGLTVQDIFDFLAYWFAPCF